MRMIIPYEKGAVRESGDNRSRTMEVINGDFAAMTTCEELANIEQVRSRYQIWKHDDLTKEKAMSETPYHIIESIMN
jgi:hypothetical protein